MIRFSAPIKLYALCLIYEVISNLSRTVLPYRMGELQTSAPLIIIVPTIAAFSGMIGARLFGNAIDRWPTKAILVTCGLGLTLGYLGLWSSSSVPMVMLSRALTAMFSCMPLITQAVLPRHIKKPALRHAYNRLGAILSTAVCLGPLLGLFLISILNLRDIDVFLVAAIVSALSVVAILVFYDTSSISPKANQTDASLPFWTLASTKTKYLIIVGCCSAFLNFYYLGTIPAMAVLVFRWAPWHFLVIISIGSAFAVLAQSLLADRLARVVGTMNATISFALIVLLATICMGIFRSEVSVEAGYVVFLASAAAMSSLLTGLISSLAKDSERGKILGAYSSFKNIAQMVAPVVAVGLSEIGHGKWQLISGAFVALLGSYMLRRTKILSEDYNVRISEPA